MIAGAQSVEFGDAEYGIYDRSSPNSDLFLFVANYDPLRALPRGPIKIFRACLCSLETTTRSPGARERRIAGCTAPSSVHAISDAVDSR